MHDDTPDTKKKWDMLPNNICPLLSARGGDGWVACVGVKCWWWVDERNGCAIWVMGHWTPS